MPDAPPLHLYAVALVFGERSGLLSCNTVLAPNPESAAALWMKETLRITPTDETLAAVQVTPVAPEFLRTALRAIKGRLPPGGEAQVLSLVPRQAIVRDPETDPLAPPPDIGHAQQHYGGMANDLASQ